MWLQRHETYRMRSEKWVQVCMYQRLLCPPRALYQLHLSLKTCPQSEMPLSPPSPTGVGGGLEPMTCKYRVQKSQASSFRGCHSEVPLMLQSSLLGHTETGLQFNCFFTQLPPSPILTGCSWELSLSKSSAQKSSSGLCFQGTWTKIVRYVNRVMTVWKKTDIWLPRFIFSSHCSALTWLESNFCKSKNENQSIKHKVIFYVILYQSKLFHNQR